MSKSIRFAIALGLGVVFVLTVSVFAFAGDSTGNAVYQQYCAGCHGANGQGTAYGPNIQGESAKEVSSVTRKGEDDEMPAYGRSAISDSQLKALAVYVAGLQKSSDDEYDRDDDDNAGGSQYGSDRDDDRDSDRDRRSNRSRD